MHDRKRRSPVILAIVVAVGLTLAALGAAAKAPEGHASSSEIKISDAVLEATADGQETTFIIYMADQADVTAAANIKNEDARGWYVYNKLTAKAESSQAGVRAQLDAADVDYTPYWAVNMILAKGGRDVVEDVAGRADVEAIEADAEIAVQDGESPESTDEGEAIEAVEPGVTSTQGPTLWASGFTGLGIVVANQDTGMRWTHTALRTHYRGWISGTTANHNYNWHDSIHARIDGSDGGTPSPVTNSCGYNALAPCDDQGHGTHTTGTSIGDDAGVAGATGTNQVGVAPGAKWIGCRNMDAGNGRASTYTECFQFFLAPTDVNNQNPDPTKRPHVMNNSWGCPQAGELCAPNVMKTVVENSVASGIFIEASNGNSGPNCNTTTDPPAIYEAAFSTGSITTSNTAPALSSFSSRGVVTVDGSSRMKPDIVAPGGSVRSTLRTSDTAYGAMSGTSMAGPHVVGTVALLWSARSKLVRDVPRTEWILTRSASRASLTVPNNSAGCGGIAGTPNNHFGWGRVRIQDAYNLEPSLNQTITFAAIADRLIDDPADFSLGATASSGLGVSYSASGSCTVSGNTVHVTGVGKCTITASQAGLDAYSIAANAPKPWYPADDVSQSFTIYYPYTGFFAPISNTGLNSATAGGVNPVKFSLGGNRGLDILAAGSPTSTQINCVTLATIGSPTATAPAGKSGLKYDAGSNQYSYAWQSEKAWKGTCRRLDLTLIDTSVHSANFQFK